MNTEEETYKVTMYLIDGTKHNVFGEISASTLLTFYDCLGRKESRVKYPVSATKQQLMPGSSVLRVEAVGSFS